MWYLIIDLFRGVWYLIFDPRTSTWPMSVFLPLSLLNLIHVHSMLKYRVPTGLEILFLFLKVREFKCCLLWKFDVILVDYRECLSRYSPIWKCPKRHVNFKKNVLLFSSVTPAALNTIQISYGISYFRHWDLSDMFAYVILWIDNQLSIKWSGKFLWKSGKNQGSLFKFFGGNPEILKKDELKLA